MAVDVAQCECSNIKCYASAFSNILIRLGVRDIATWQEGMWIVDWWDFPYSATLKSWTSMILSMEKSY